jgi:hypothetical protein
LLKNIREGQGQNADNLRKAAVGAVSVMPYFQLEPDDTSPIDYSDFIAKTKSALYYYRKNVTGNKSVNVMYYIGDKPQKNYVNDPGYGGQKNKAHFVELASALAIIDFLSLDKNSNHLECEVVDSSSDGGGKKRGRAVRPTWRELGIRESAEIEATPHMFHFYDEVSNLLAMPLSRFALFRKYMEEEYKKDIAWKTETGLDNSFLSETFYKNHMQIFLKDFYNWLEELSENNRGFFPFNLVRDSDLKLFI